MGRLWIRIVEIPSHDVVADFDWTNQVNLVFWEGFYHHGFDPVKYHDRPDDLGACEIPEAE